MESMGWQCRAENIDLSVGHFINGEIVSCSGDNSITKKSPRDGSLLYQFAGGGGKEVNEAVSVSRQALDDGRWSSLSIQQRKIVIYKLAELVESHKEKFAFYESLDVGKPVDQSFSDISWATNILRECAEGADKLISSSSMDGLNYQVRKPIGVVAAIIGWNFPLVLAAQKVGPALVMGNSLVLKPSEYSALSATLLASLALEAGVPPGVFNVVQGAGATVGAALAHHNSVNLLTFTGSSATGKKMMIAAGQSNMKRLMLECGGKSPYIVFEDCPEDLDFIAQDIVETAFRNQGQVCVAGTRLLIHKNLKAPLLEKVKYYTAQLKPGDPLNPETNFGPLINKTQLDKVMAYKRAQKRAAK